MRKFLKVAAGALALAGVAQSASGATATANFTVSATVAASCTISASNLSFGTYAGSQLDINSTLTANCLTGTSYSIALNQGTSVGATTSTRKLTSGANTIAYELFSDAARTANWGNSAGVDTVGGTGTGAAQSIAVYGRIAAGLTPVAGSYTDTIVATITF